MTAKSILEKLPPSVYHAQDGEIEVFSNKNLTFNCACGNAHLVRESIAIVDTGLTNMAVYSCPTMAGCFSLVKAKGLLRINALKTIDTARLDNESERERFIANLESRKKTD